MFSDIGQWRYQDFLFEGSEISNTFNKIKFHNHQITTNNLMIHLFYYNNNKKKITIKRVFYFEVLEVHYEMLDVHFEVVQVVLYLVKTSGRLL